jgi:hypothetical protein
MSASKSSRRLLRASVPLGLVGALLAVVACTEQRTDLGGDPPATPAFVDPDAGALAPDGNEVRSYCPSDRCPPGHTTCPNSRFLCDIDLLTDPDNCGECGNACRSSSFGSNEEYACVEGRCVMTCQVNNALDCDGLPDNGCEISPLSNDHCGVCGNKCPADKPCVDRGIMDYGCGCRPGELYCPNPSFPLLPCVDPENDDEHCGACNNACPPEGDGSETPPPNTYFGCHESQCGTLKCTGGYGDCDAVRDNGCEVFLIDNDNCGGCGTKCQEGQQCRIGKSFMPECMCPEGQTLCGAGCIGNICWGSCADLTSERENCGACGVMCAYNVTNAVEACVYGKCQRTCDNGWGDCNGNRDDGCETHIAADPKNCGGCGIVCDGIAGQACVDGQCMVEPCDVIQDAGGPTR